MTFNYNNNLSSGNEVKVVKSVRVNVIICNGERTCDSSSVELCEEHMQVFCNSFPIYVG